MVSYFIPAVFIIWCPTCTKFGQWEPFQGGVCVPLISSFHFSGTSLLSGTERDSRLFNSPCLSPRISYFPMDPSFLWEKIVLRNEDLGARCARWHGVLLLWGCLSGQSVGIWMHTHRGVCSVSVVFTENEEITPIHPILISHHSTTPHWDLTPRTRLSPPPWIHPAHCIGTGDNLLWALPPQPWHWAFLAPPNCLRTGFLRKGRKALGRRRSSMCA